MTRNTSVEAPVLIPSIKLLQSCSCILSWRWLSFIPAIPSSSFCHFCFVPVYLSQISQPSHCPEMLFFLCSMLAGHLRALCWTTIGLDLIDTPRPGTCTACLRNSVDLDFVVTQMIGSNNAIYEAKMIVNSVFRVSIYVPPVSFVLTYEPLTRHKFTV